MPLEVGRELPGAEQGLLHHVLRTVRVVCHEPRDIAAEAVPLGYQERDHLLPLIRVIMVD
ncbi:hypothetical protein ACWEO4_29825 [Streptomyces sp. NPDC004393]